MNGSCRCAGRLPVLDWKARGGWRPASNQQERDSRAALVDHPPPTTFTDVARAVLWPATGAITRHAVAAARAIWVGLRAAITTYRQSLPSIGDRTP